MSEYYHNGPHEQKSPLSWESAKRVASFLREGATIEAADDLPQMQQYELLRLLGCGAASSVYLALPAGIGDRRAVAVKLFNYGLGNGPSTARALRELELLAALQHPSVPCIHDYGTDCGRFFIATGVVDGDNLDIYCEANALDRDDRVTLVIKIAQAVQQLHEVGVIHRDLKPSNVMISKAGEPVLIDFGIASLLDQDQSESITSHGLPIGSPGFMAPEQARGELTAISIRSDVYAIGAIACVLLTGHTPHDTTVPLHEAIRRIGGEPPRHPAQLDPTIPKPLAAIIAKSTACDPKDRFASAAELADYLEKWLRHEPIAIARPSIAQRLAYRVRRNPLLSLISTAAVLAIMAAVYFGTAAAAESRLADEHAALASEQAELAEARLAFAKEQQAFRQQASGHLNRLRGIVARFVTDARAHGDNSQYGQALGLILAIDNLLDDKAFIEPGIREEHRALRVGIVINALREVYRTSEFGGDDVIEKIEQALHELERSR